MLNEGPKMLTPPEFVQSAAQSDGYELAAAQDALAQSRSPQVRTFAEQMLADHARVEQALRDAAVASGLAPPQPHVGGDQMRFLASLQSLRGSDFDREYARQQVLAHTSALTTMRSYAASGSDANLRRAAAFVMPIIERHLLLARQMKDALGEVH
jgi:putative membrane protein